jgi:hypothetical protein
VSLHGTVNESIGAFEELPAMTISLLGFSERKQIVRKFHPAEVERESELTIFQEISLKSPPE